MQTPWIVAFAVLSLIVVAETLLLIGALRNIASLEYRMRLAGFDDLGGKATEIRRL